MSSPRFSCVAHPSGVVIVDLETGAVSFVAPDGQSVRQLRAHGDDAGDDPSAVADADTIVREYPLPIAWTWARVLAARNPTLRCAALVECFVVSLKYWTLTLLHEYLATDLRDPRLDGLLRGWNRPLTSRWTDALERLLGALAQRESSLAGLRAAVTALELRRVPREPRRRHPADGALTESPGSSSPFEALLAFRNAMAHDPLPRAERAAELADRYLVVLRDVLRATRCVVDHPLYVAHPTGECWQLMGCTPTRTTPVGAAGAVPPTGVFLASRDGDQFLPIAFPFDHLAAPGRCDAEGFLMLESFEGEGLVYHSLGGEVIHRRWPDHPWSARVAARPPSAVLSHRTFDALRDLLADSTRRRLARWRDRRAWEPELVVETQDLRALDRFVRAPLAGDAAPWTLLSAARGMGRTTALAWLADRLGGAAAVMIVSCADWWPSQCEERLLVELGLPPREPGGLAALCARIAGSVPPDGRVVLLLDDVDALGDIDRLDRFLRLLETVERYRWLRVVLGCAAGREKTRGMSLSGYTADELVLAYRQLQRYTRADEDGLPQAVSSPTTSADALRNLSPVVRSALSHPRSLRMLAERYNQQPLPLAFLLEEVGELRWEHLTRTAAGDRASGRLAAAANGIARIMLDARSDTVTREALVARPELQAWVSPSRPGGVDALLLELRAEGLLIEEPAAGELTWRFADSQVLEAIVVRSHIDALQDHWRLWQLALEWRDASLLRGALVTLLVRLCQRGRHALVLDAIDYAQGESRRPFLHAAARCLERLAVAEFEGLPALLAELVATPTANDAEVLFVASNAALHTASPSGLREFVRALDALSAYRSSAPFAADQRLLLARALLAASTRANSDETRRAREILEALWDDRASLPSPMVRTLRVMRFRGETEADGDTLLGEVGEAPPDATWAQACLHRAQIAIRSEAWGDARHWCDRAGRVDDGRARLDAALARQWVEYCSGDSAAVLAEDLVPAAEALGHLDLLRRALGQRAIARNALGAWSDAVADTERAVELARRTGSAPSLMTSLRNLGGFRLDVGDLDGSRSALRECIDLAQRESRDDITFAALLGLAIVEHELGHTGASEAALSQSLAVPLSPASKRRPVLWLRWCRFPSQEHEDAWRATLDAGAVATAGERAHLLAFDLWHALDAPDLVAARRHFEAIVETLAQSPWQRELYELPVTVAARLWRAARDASDDAFAECVFTQCVAWVNGRPWRAMSAFSDGTHGSDSVEREPFTSIVPPAFIA